MKYIFLVSAFLFLGNFLLGQNLVPNPGFEERAECIYNDGSLNDAPPWYNPCTFIFVPATPDVFHECTIVNEDPCPYPEDKFLDPWLFGVPTNVVGCEIPHSGAGYAGASFYYPEVDVENQGYREYLGITLLQPMEAGQTYEVSFWISLAERNTHAIWNVQVLFTEDSAYQLTDSYMEYAPQLHGTPGDFIDNYDGWRQLEWQYTAEGGERYMYIGNFQPNSETDTIRLKTWELWMFDESAYYYIDDVQVLPEGETNVVRHLSSSIEVLPNPFVDFITIKNTPVDEDQMNYWVFSVDGLIQKSGSVTTDPQRINLSLLTKGSYIFQVTSKHKVLFNQKLIKF